MPRSHTLVMPDVRHYEPATQELVRLELATLGCLPNVGQCAAPVTTAWLKDYHKMREQVRVAQDAEMQ